MNREINSEFIWSMCVCVCVCVICLYNSSCVQYFSTNNNALMSFTFTFILKTEKCALERKQEKMQTSNSRPEYVTD